MRLFIAVNLNPSIKRSIGKLIEKLQKQNAPIKWVDTKNLHITLRFIGWVPDDKLEEITRKAQEALVGFRAFKASFSGAGVFPTEKNPRVLWVGINEGAGELVGLAENLDRNFAQLGFKTEKREFSPHITIGRAKESKKKKISKSEIRKLAEELAKYQEQFFGEMMIDRVLLFKSTLSPKGPVYEGLEEIRLG